MRKFKPKEEQVRMIFGEAHRLAALAATREHPGKVFAVIGPFEGFGDKADLQEMLEVICRGYNLKPR